jgi:hypothetical protein
MTVDLLRPQLTQTVKDTANFSPHAILRNLFWIETGIFPGAVPDAESTSLHVQAEEAERCPLRVLTARVRQRQSLALVRNLRRPRTLLLVDRFGDGVKRGLHYIFHRALHAGNRSRVVGLRLSLGVSVPIDFRCVLLKGREELSFLVVVCHRWERLRRSALGGNCRRTDLIDNDNCSTG